MSERVAIRRGEVPKAPKRPVPKRAKPKAAPVARIPVAPKRVARWMSSAIALLAVVGGAVGLWLAGVPQSIWFDTASSVGRAGFEVREVEVNGLQNLARLPVYNAAVAGPSDSMLLVDLDEVRERLLALPWVADASVARRLPDRLVIDVVERKPVALWQYRRRMAVVDREGRVLDTKGLERFAALPLLVGADANREARPLMTMLADFPEVQQRVDSAIWIGDRRWDIRFKSGETLSLPEGYGRARTALTNFAKLEQDSGLLEKGFVRFDMRLPDRMVVRVTGEPGAQALPVSGTEI